MATKIFIIDVDLGRSIDSIIAEDVAELTGNVKKELDDVIAINKTAQTIINSKKLKKENELSNTVLIYDALLKSGLDGMTSEELLVLAKPYVSSTAGLISKLKAYLRKNGSYYRINKKKDNGKLYYYLEQFNNTNDETTIDLTTIE